VNESWKNVFLDLEAHVDDLFEELIYRPWAITGSASWRPPLDLFESREQYLVELDLPGLALQELSVRVDARTLVVSGEKKAPIRQGFTALSSERRAGCFQRSLSFPHAIEPHQVQAELVDGVLKIRLPKKASSLAPGPESENVAAAPLVVVQIYAR